MLWKLDITLISANGIRETPVGSKRSPETPTVRSTRRLNTRQRKASGFREWSIESVTLFNTIIRIPKNKRQLHHRSCLILLDHLFKKCFI